MLAIGVINRGLTRHIIICDGYDMQCEASYVRGMAIKIKIILITSAFLVLAAAVSLFARWEKKQTELVVSQKVVIDEFAGWQTYFGMKKGFDIRIPPTWSKNYDHDGLQPYPKGSFWREQVGRVGFLAYVDDALPKLSILIKDSELELQAFAEAIGMEKAEDATVAGMLAKKERGEDTEKVLIQNRRRFFYLVFTSPKENFEKDILILEKILSTFTLSEMK